MKRITKLGNNRYIHMDLDTSRKHPFYVAFFNGVMTVFVISIAAITVGAMVGLDITKTQSTPTQQVK
jgi:hypothetical protein